MNWFAKKGTIITDSIMYHSCCELLDVKGMVRTNWIGLPYIRMVF